MRRYGFRRDNPLWLAIVVLIGLALAQPITASNWATHPKIKEIRAIYLEVAKLRSQNKLQKASKSFAYCPALDLERTLLTDARGVVRFYESSGGSDDSAATLEHTYDAWGRLRFVLVKAGAVNDTHTEYRYYLSQTGTLLWKDQRIEGQGYPFADFREYFAFDAKKAFAAPSPCR